jgi:predicted aldo/keto reductase-like oxidoreductase
MGVMNSDSPALVKAAYERGITFFDTANVYQNGRNEEMLGKAFKDYPRNSFILATKVQPNGEDRATGTPTSATTADDFVSKFNTSLKRLGMDYVDILNMHRVMTPEMVSFKPIVMAMKRLKKEGKVRFIGVSTHNLPAIIDTMVKAKTWDVVLATYNYLGKVRLEPRLPPPPRDGEAPRQIDPEMMKKMNEGSSVSEMDIALKKANEAGIGVIAMKTIAGGGFLDKERTKPVNTTAAIKWVLNNPNVHIAIPGMTNFEQLELNMKILENISMNEQEKEDIMLAQAEKGLYCTSCRNCIPGCRFNLPIPDLMRVYMYVYGYRNFEQAHNLINELSTGEDPCKNCSMCTAICSRRFDLKEKITDISRIVNIPADFIS